MTKRFGERAHLGSCALGGKSGHMLRGHRLPARPRKSAHTLQLGQCRISRAAAHCIFTERAPCGEVDPSREGILSCRYRDVKVTPCDFALVKGTLVRLVGPLSVSSGKVMEFKTGAATWFVGTLTDEIVLSAGVPATVLLGRDKRIYTVIAPQRLAGVIVPSLRPSAPL